MVGEIGGKSEPWNVAQGYTTLKILTHLVESDKLVKIAIYGAENIEDSLLIDKASKISNRLEAIKRLVDCLKIIIENSDFAIKESDKDKVDKIKKKIKEVEDVLDGIEHITIDQRTNFQALNITEEHFRNCLKELREIKTELPKILNDNKLIFPGSDEIDLDALKEALSESG